MPKIKIPESFEEIFLQPGEMHFGERETRIRTLLGSCVAITLWHPHKLIGGMCHFVLPTNYNANPDSRVDGRYADQAMRLFMRVLNQTNTLPAEYEAKIFGGGSQFSGPFNAKTMSVPDKNILAGYSLLDQYGFKVKGGDLGGTGSRYLVFDVWSGHVWQRHVETG